MELSPSSKAQHGHRLVSLFDTTVSRCCTRFCSQRVCFAHRTLVAVASQQGDEISDAGAHLAGGGETKLSTSRISREAAKKSIFTFAVSRHRVRQNRGLLKLDVGRKAQGMLTGAQCSQVCVDPGYSASWHDRFSCKMIKGALCPFAAAYSPSNMHSMTTDNGVNSTPNRAGRSPISMNIS